MSQYHSRPVSNAGEVDWSAEEDQIWSELVARQLSVIGDRACRPYLDGLNMLNLTQERVPEINDINEILRRETGWQVEPVAALINFDRFFSLLSEKKFPVATFLRTREEFDYLQEPDFFHEIFGHCAMLTHHDFAAFTHAYGILGKAATHQERVYLARLYWFTVEFGLVKENGESKIYGGGILSSPGETIYSLDSQEAQRKPFDIQTVLRTPYRIDIMQPIYYELNDITELYHLSQQDLMSHVHRAMGAQMLPPLFELKAKTKDMNHA